MADDEKPARIVERAFETVADLLRETNAEVSANGRRIEENGRRIEENGRRIDEVTAEVVELRAGLGRLEGRFDHLLEVAGGETRRLREGLDDLRVRVERLERKAS